MTRDRSASSTVVRWIFRSIASRLVLLIIVFAAVPFIIYSQLQKADQEKLDLLLQAAEEQGALVAHALRPIVDEVPTRELLDVNDALQSFGGRGVRVRVLLIPASISGPDGAFFVASAPSVSNQYLAVVRRELDEAGILARVAQSCDLIVPEALRVSAPGGRTELLTSITPYQTEFGCWVFTTWQTTSKYLDSAIGQPYYKTPEVRLALAIYIAMAILVLLVFIGVWRNLISFGRLARRLGEDDRSRTGSFAAQNTIPELSPVARDFDRMVGTMHESAESIRRAAEDNAHAFKTPMAVIRQSVEPLRRQIKADDGRAVRAIEMIESSVDRLDQLVSSAQRMDEATADLIDPPRDRVDVTGLLRRMLGVYGELVARRGISLERDLTDRLIVRAGNDLMETVIENVVDNAISFTPSGGKIRVKATRDGKSVLIGIDDSGPGVGEDRLVRIFDRYFSERDPEPQADADNGTAHAGIGLWVVRRNVEAVGGSVSAERSDLGGLQIRIRIPVDPS